MPGRPATGQFVVVTNQGMCLRLDRTGKEVKQFRLQGVASFGNDLLANGNVLIPLSWQNRVTEYDMEGKVVWDANVPQPLGATRLPNGNTLVVCQQWPPLDRRAGSEGQEGCRDQECHVCQPRAAALRPGALALPSAGTACYP